MSIRVANFGFVLASLLLFAALCQASPIQNSPSQTVSSQTYQQAISLAAHGDDQAAMAALAIIQLEPVWQQRMAAAQQLLGMRMQHEMIISPQTDHNPHLMLATAHVKHHPQVELQAQWPALVLATVLPGAGHAWLGRWRDASTAALMVWPMLLLTLWAGRRKMGPVTVFFALITIWLWSGTVFSSVSLAERSAAETYMLWWQGIWQASGLPGRPWS